MISSHTAWPNSKGSSRDNEEEEDSSVKTMIMILRRRKTVQSIKFQESVR